MDFQKVSQVFRQKFPQGQLQEFLQIFFHEDLGKPPGNSPRRSFTVSHRRSFSNYSRSPFRDPFRNSSNKFVQEFLQELVQEFLQEFLQHSNQGTSVFGIYRRVPSKIPLGIPSAIYYRNLLENPSGIPAGLFSGITQRVYVISAGVASRFFSIISLLAWPHGICTLK